MNINDNVYFYLYTSVYHGSIYSINDNNTVDVITEIGLVKNIPNDEICYGKK